MLGTKFSRRQILAGVCLALASGAAALEDPVSPPAPGAVFERVIVLGASASAGFALPVHLGNALDLMIVATHAPVACVADERFFLDPDGVGAEQIAAALEFEPTLVVAIDFLFWYGYGNVSSEAARLPRLEHGLALLDKLECPVVVSTLPDMSAAVGKMLRASQLPEPAALKALNERLLAWVEAREDAILLPLPELLTRLRSGDVFDYGGESWPPAGKKLMQWDDLHPTVEGLTVLACEAMERIASSREIAVAGVIRVDPQHVASGLFTQIEAIRAERKARRLEKR